MSINVKQQQHHRNIKQLQMAISKVLPAVPRGARVLLVYAAADGYRWNLSYNDTILADGGQAYSDRPSAKAAALRNGVGEGFPLVLRYEKHSGRGKFTWVQERIR